MVNLNINFDEFEDWLTPEVVENAFHNAGYEVELKDDYKGEKTHETRNQIYGVNVQKRNGQEHD